MWKNKHKMGFLMKKIKQMASNDVIFCNFCLVFIVKFYLNVVLRRTGIVIMYNVLEYACYIKFIEMDASFN